MISISPSPRFQPWGKGNAMRGHAFTAGYDAFQLSSFNNYLRSINQDTLTQGLFNSYDSCDFDPGAYYLLPQPQPLPSFMECNAAGSDCLDCGTMISLIQQFKDTIPSPYNAGPVTTMTLDQAAIRHNELLAKFLNYRTGFNYTWQQYLDSAAQAGCNLAGFNGSSPATLNVYIRESSLPPSYQAKDTINFLPGFIAAPNDIFEAYLNSDTTGMMNRTVICRSDKYVTDTSGFAISEGPCARVYNMAVGMAQQLFLQRYESKLADFEQAYKAKCLAAQEGFSVSYEKREYHYTLYYYDMAGNLVKTVPPKGVRPRFNKSFTDSVRIARDAGIHLRRPHELVTQYAYNSLNQVTAQVSPDGGRSLFWYDKLGRLAVSQNAQQREESKFSYTKYDELGRITEVGQKSTTEEITQTISQYPLALTFWLTENGDREDLTITQYDRYFGYPSATPTLRGHIEQQNLRNRVSYTLVQKNANDGAEFYTGTFYTYDIHGNVDTLLQYYKNVTAMSANKYRLIAYDYDLISGKVNGVDYQPDYHNGVSWQVNPDKFFHRYQYDAENRLVTVETSRDKLVWERDASYLYYKHGPLARTELGQLQVQGLDYAYALQGWLKGVNSVTPNSDKDLGGDGASGTVVARDAFGFGLHYYDDKATEVDYRPVNSSKPVAFPRPSATTGIRSMYNGNIAAMSATIVNSFDRTAGVLHWDPLFYRYKYDQLNRLKAMKAYKGLSSNNQWIPNPLKDYEEDIAYDPNGNILTYSRAGAPERGTPMSMDLLTYNYKANSNQLEWVDDAIPNGNYTEDIDDQAAGNYTYDKIGNMKTDVKEGITNIKWTVYGKIAEITRSGSTISYTYDAAGNRITKTVGNLTTVYVRDASGNVMSVYEKLGVLPLKQTELHFPAGS
ncbi:MAG: RHS repeat protein [Sphingobacteriales bacterium]|nr:MAG: RHS repeat protein [Sphingobacteriales bacterium]